MPKCLVTGAAGFIGTHLVHELIAQGNEVFGLDNLSGCNSIESIHRCKENIEWGGTYSSQYRNSFHYRDFSNYLDLQKVYADIGHVDHIYHVGALPRVQYSIAEPLKTHNANINGTLNMLLAAKDLFKASRFIFSSSSSVYGDQDTLPLHEDMKPNPLSPYALHKLTGEHYCKQFYEIYGLETISLRYFNVYGERQDPDSSYSALIPKFAKLMYEGDQAVIYGDGEQTRDFTNVADVVRANILAANTSNEFVFGKSFNIGGGSQISVNDIAGMIKDRVLFYYKGSEDLPKSPIHGEPVVESRHTKADIHMAEEHLDWAPEVDFKEGLEKTVISIVREML